MASTNAAFATTQNAYEESINAFILKTLDFLEQNKLSKQRIFTWETSKQKQIGAFFTTLIRFRCRLLWSF